MEIPIAFYSRENAEKLQRRSRAAGAAAWCIAGAGLAACVILCGLTDTLNAVKMEKTVIAVSTLAGWAVIFLLLNVLRPAKTEAAHELLVLEDEPEEHRGAFTVGKTAAKIKDSISVYTVTMENGTRLSVNSSKVNELKKIKGEAVLYSVHGFITGYGEEHE